MKIGIVSDTHGKMHPGVAELFDGVDAVFHAGDIGNEDILLTLQSVAPVYAITGNTDPFPLLQRCPEHLCATLGGVRIFMTHILQPFTVAAARERLRQAGERQDPAVFIYGHTHQARIERLGPILTINPGSAGPPRFRSTAQSVAFLEIEGRHTLRARAHSLS